MKILDPKKEIRRLAKWRAKSEFMLDNSVRGVETRLAKKIDAGIAASSDFIATWYGNLGNEKLLAGNQLGWNDIRRCIDYRACGIRLFAAYQEIGRCGSIFVYQVARWLSTAIAFHMDSFASWLGDLVVSSLSGNQDRFKLVPMSHPYHLAFIQFYSIWKRDSFQISSVTKESLGVYQAVLDHWHENQGYVDAVKGACEYHLERKDVDYSEFDMAPQDLLPVEILMIRRIREDHGLPNPEIDHPLMQTPLGKAPRTLPEVKDELLERVIAKARKELEHFPEF